MGVYVVPELVAQGFKVDVTSRNTNSRISSIKNTRCIVGNAHDEAFVREVVNNKKYDLIVDFMLYETKEFRERIPLLISAAKRYIYVSSYRVYADSDVLNEQSPQLIDTLSDEDFLKSNDYCLEKARQERILQELPEKNWTIVRPGITYSTNRFQLVTLEADSVVWRARHGLTTILPGGALERVTTMTWAGDVAKMIVGVAVNPKSEGEDYIVATAESHTWAEVRDIYTREINLQARIVDQEKYINALGGGHVRHQLAYDRMYDRRIDNAKILTATGMQQSELKTLSKGLHSELQNNQRQQPTITINPSIQAGIDRALGGWKSLRLLNGVQRQEYLQSRSPRVAMWYERALKMPDKIKRKVRLRTRLRKAKNSISVWRVSRRNNKADGAIVTITGYYNYGNLIQRYALQKFLQNNGYDFVSYARNVATDTNPDPVKYRYTYDFVQRNIWQKQFSEDDEYPMYVVGSDQVWRNWGYHDVFYELGYYFLNFTQERAVKRIAYAASIGQDSLDGALITSEASDYLLPLVKQFDHISMREKSGVNIVDREWGASSRLVVDPTLLLTRNDYDDLIGRHSYHDYTAADKKKAFSYFILTNESKRNATNSILNSLDVTEQGICLEEESVLPPVEYWLQSIRDSAVVITDSFHGVVFSIIYNTPFVVLESGTGGSDRLVTLLQKLGLEHRIVQSENVQEFLRSGNIEQEDWSVVNERVEDMRKDSADWLINSIRS